MGIKKNQALEVKDTPEGECLLRGLINFETQQTFLSPTRLTSQGQHTDPPAPCEQTPVKHFGLEISARASFNRLATETFPHVFLGGDGGQGDQMPGAYCNQTHNIKESHDFHPCYRTAALLSKQKL